MNPLEEDCFNQLLQELSVIQDNEPTTQTSAQQSSTAGAITNSTSATRQASSSANSAMTPVFLTRVIRATMQDILHSS